MKRQVSINTEHQRHNESRQKYKNGQAIIWFAKVTKRGEPQYKVPGTVVGLTVKRVAIKVLTRQGQFCIRYVTPKRIRLTP